MIARRTHPRVNWPKTCTELDTSAACGVGSTHAAPRSDEAYASLRPNMPELTTPDQHSICVQTTPRSCCGTCVAMIQHMGLHIRRKHRVAPERSFALRDDQCEPWTTDGTKYIRCAVHQRKHFITTTPPLSNRGADPKARRSNASGWAYKALHQDTLLRRYASGVVGPR